MKSVIIYLAVTLWAFASSESKAQKQSPPPGAQPKDFTLPAKQEISLPNGLRATMVPYGEVPKASVSLIVQVGNVHEHSNENGLADIVAQLMREGTANRNGKQIADEVARMGGSLNISVSGNQTILSGSVLSEYVPEMVRLMADLVQNPAFPQSEIERVKNDFKRSMNLARNQPGTQADVKYRSILYPNHPYGAGLPTDETINAFHVDQVREFYEKQFGAQRTTLYVVGKFDALATREAITSALRDMPQGPPPRIEVAKPVTKSDVVVIDRPGAPQSTVVLGLPVIDPSHPDYTLLKITNSLLGGSFGSRITRNIREDKGYTYSPRSTLVPRFRAGDWSERADVTTEQTGNSLKEIMYEINRLRKVAPPAEELAGIKNYEAGLFVLQNSSPGGIISQLNFLDLHNLPDSYLTNQVQKIHEITPGQVQEAARQYLRPDDMTLIVVGDQKVIQPQLKKFEEDRKKAL